MSDKDNNEFLLQYRFLTYLITTYIKDSVLSALQILNGFITTIPPGSIKEKKKLFTILVKAVRQTLSIVVSSLDKVCLTALTSIVNNFFFL